MVAKVKRQDGWNKLITEYKKVRTLTKEQIKDIKKNTLEQAKKALMLRKDLLKVMKSLDEDEDWRAVEYYWLQRYLMKNYANLEYELFNNGAVNLVDKLGKLWDRTDNDELEEVIRKISKKKYGNSSVGSYGDCLECGGFGELDNGWGQNEGYHYECRPSREIDVDKKYAN